MKTLDNVCEEFLASSGHPVPEPVFVRVEKQNGFGFVLVKADSRTALEAASDNDRECELAKAGAGWEAVSNG